jgi:hypothetical protein
MITKLTEAQEKQLKLYKEKWIEIGLRTGPANKDRVENLVAQIYQVADLQIPKEILWFDSPKAAKSFIKEKDLSDFACYGQHDANWLSFYDYFYEVMGDNKTDEGKTFKELCEPLKPLIELAKEIGWFWCYENLCIVSQRPVRLSLKYVSERDIKVLHDDHGPAILYADGSCGYYLNGVRMVDKGKMLPELVTTEASQLDAKVIHSIENAEVRQEVIKKIGLDRLYNELKTQTVDTFEQYELVDLKLSEEETGRYLKMINPSTGEPHVEGVPNEALTVKQALMWRNGFELNQTYIKPKVLT